MTAVLGPVGAGYDLNGSGSQLATFVVPAGVTRGDYDGYFVITWTAAVTGEVPPTVTPIGSGWTTLVAPRTIALLGWAVYRKSSGLATGDVVTFTISATRAVTALDFYVIRASTPAAGTPTDRAASSTVTTAAPVSTTEDAELVLMISAERSTGIGTTVTPAGATTYAYREGLNGACSILVATVPGPTPLGTTVGASATYSVASTAGGAVQVAVSTAVIATPAVGLLIPSNEQVAVAWLKSAVTYLGSRVATELPTDNSTWSASGFVTVSGMGGTPDMYLPQAHPVISVDSWGAATRSSRPPWGLAGQQAEQIRRAVLDHPNVPRVLAMPSGFRSAAVQQVIPRTEPRRIPGDVAGYAHYQQDLEFWWVMGP